MSNSFNSENTFSPPHNLLAEKNILAELLLNKVKSDLIFTRLTPEMFYLKEHQIIYNIGYSLHKECVEININTISDRLGKDTILNDTDNISFLLDIINLVVPFADLESYIVLIIDKYLRRKLISTLSSISGLALNSSISLENLFDEAESRLLDVTQKKPNLGLVPASEVLLESFTDLEQRAGKGGFLGTPSGFFELDNMTQGFQKSDLVIIAGRPSMGKTAFALNIARNVAELQTYPVTIFSLEMSRQQIVYRFLSNESQVINSKLRSGSINISEWKSISQAISILSGLKIYLDDTPNTSVREIKSKLERLKSKSKNIGLVVIDYLQLLSDVDNKDSRVNELAKITRNLKILAREINVPVLVLSQLSRNVESRTNKRPILSDLRESGCISPNSKIYISRLNREIFISNPLATSYENTLSFSISELFSKNALKKRIFITGKKTLYELCLYQKIKLNLTSNHKILTNIGWTKLLDFSSSNLICTLDRNNFAKFSIFYSQRFKRVNPDIFLIGFLYLCIVKQSKVYDIWVPGFGNFIVNDCVVHNSIEQDADVVLMLYREDYYNPSKIPTSIADVIIAKHRNGPIGTVHVSFDVNVASFGNSII
jgi:replicative DNA helicase